MKNVAITQRLIKNERHPEIRDALDVRWAILLERLGYLPILLPTNYDFRRYFEAFPVYGVILTGGNDLSKVLPDDELSQKRDVFEKTLLAFAIEKGIPILGICRGMQTIADYFNGTFKKILDHAGTRHKLTVSDKSKFHRELKMLESVNSYHNYCVETVSSDIIISAVSEDGSIEAIEHKNHLIFGQMWHSERENPFCKHELDIIRSLFRQKMP